MRAWSSPHLHNGQEPHYQVPYYVAPLTCTMARSPIPATIVVSSTMNSSFSILPEN